MVSGQITPAKTAVGLHIRGASRRLEVARARPGTRRGGQFAVRLPTSAGLYRAPGASPGTTATPSLVAERVLPRAAGAAPRGTRAA